MATEQADSSAEAPRVRPAFVVALAVVVGALALVAAFVLGHRSGGPQLSTQDVQHLEQLRQLGEMGEGSSIANAVRSDDEQVRLAVVVQHGLAADLSATSAALLSAADEDGMGGDGRASVFDRSSWTDLSQAERDAAYRDECREWARQVEELTTPAAIDSLSEELRPLVDELGLQAEEVRQLCTT